jgi:hypothetical protein
VVSGAVNGATSCPINHAVNNASKCAVKNPESNPAVKNAATCERRPDREDNATQHVRVLFLLLVQDFMGRI